MTRRTLILILSLYFINVRSQDNKFEAGFGSRFLMYDFSSVQNAGYNFQLDYKLGLGYFFSEVNTMWCNKKGAFSPYSFLTHIGINAGLRSSQTNRLSVDLSPGIRYVVGIANKDYSGQKSIRPQFAFYLKSGLDYKISKCHGVFFSFFFSKIHIDSPKGFHTSDEVENDWRLNVGYLYFLGKAQQKNKKSSND